VTASTHAHLVQSGHIGRVGQIQGFERAADDPRDHRVAVPFAVCGHDEPRRPFGTAAFEGDLVRQHLVVPILALGEIARVELPSLGGIVQPGLKPRLLLLVRRNFLGEARVVKRLQ